MGLKCVSSRIFIYECFLAQLFTKIRKIMETMEMEGIDNELDDILSGDRGDFSVLSIFIAIFML